MSYRPEDVLMDLQGKVADNEITREQAMELARFAIPTLTADDLEEWFPITE